MTPSTIEDVYPLSPTQEGLLSHSLRAPGSGIYVEQMRVTLRGRLDQAALHRAWQDTVDRHPALRTVFAWQREQPLQVVRRQVEVPFTVLDWRELSEREAAEREEHLLAQDRERGFDLHTAPLMRVVLLHLADDTHRMIWTHHHIILDGWSVALVLGEVERRYTAARGGPSPNLAPVRPFREYLAWLKAQDSTAHEAFWRKTLTDHQPVELDILGPEQAVSGSQESAVEITVDSAERDALLDALRARRLTLSTAVEAAWALVLARYTGSGDVVFGISTSARPSELAGVEEMVGLFVNTLPLRVPVTSGRTVDDWLTEVQEAVNDLRDHEHVSPLEVQRWSGLPPTRAPFDTVVVTQNAARDFSEWTGFADLQVTGVEFFVRTNFPVMLMALPADSLRLRLIFDPGRLTEPAARRLLGHVRTVLSGLFAAPDRTLAEVPLLSKEERGRIERWNAGGSGTLAPAPTHRLVEDMARQRPDAIAVSQGDRELTYAELHAAAGRLARRLTAHGVGRDTVVPLCLGRSTDLIIGILAAHRAGGAFCVLDPADPPGRLSRLVEDLAPRVIVTNDEHAAAVPATAVPVLRLEQAPSVDAPGAPLPEVAGDWLSYVVFTSGSTGRPKGVQIEHAGLRNVVDHHLRLWGLTDADAVLQFCAITFDVFILEVFSTLASGARLVIGAPDELIPGPRLAELIDRAGVTAATFTPSALELLPAEATLPGVHTLSVAGEACSADLVRRFAPGRRFFNLYGPAEMAIVSTVARCAPSDATPPIGYPVDNVQCHVLAADGQPLPIGVIGELYLGGVGIARGYLGLPELTAERFLDTPRGRLYQTGDLVRRAEDGSLEFIGRADQQIKVRGFRVEPGEIEALLREHPAVSQAAVVAQGTGSQRGLAGYLALDRDTEDFAGATEEETDEQLRAWRGVYDQTYATAANPAEVELNTAGWLSSYTGEPIPRAEMKEWVDTTLDRVLTARPTDVLEIGCGTGMLLLPLARAGVPVTGTDASPAAISALRERLALPEYAGQRVHLLEAMADDFSQLGDQRFDLVVINSVIQYFPSADYLRRVLDGALRRLRPGGRLLVGDVRSLPLLDAFHLSVQLERQPGDSTAAEAWRTARAQAGAEEELTVHPDFFRRVAADQPAPCAVSVLAKRGRHRNEMTRFRYDVVLTPGQPTTGSAPGTRMHWEHDIGTVEELRRQLAEAPEVLLVEAIPDGRTAGALAAVADLAAGDADPATTVDELRERSAPTGVDPTQLLTAAEESAYTVELLLGSEPGLLTAVFLRAPLVDAQPHRAGDLAAGWYATQPAPVPWRECASDPLRERRERRIVTELRTRLTASLPSHLVPSSLTVLAEFPRNPNGKIDRKALSLSGGRGPAQRRHLTLARDSTELRVAQIWAEAIGTDQIDVTDNFFHIGGHSLLAMRVTSTLSREFDRDLDLRALFERPSVEQMAALLRSEGAGSRKVAVPLRAAGTQRPFFVVHPASGNVLAYQELCQALGDDIPLWGLEEPPNVADRATVRAAAESYAAVVRDVQPEGPYRLGGWSFGGMVAYELARVLTAEGAAVELVALFDSSLPVHPEQRPTDREQTAGRFLRFAHYLATSYSRSIPLTADQLVELDEDAQLDLLISACVAAGIIGEGTDPALLRDLYATYRHSVRAASDYQPGAYRGRVVLYRASEPLPGDVRDAAYDREDATLGWAEPCPGVEVVPVPGNHLTLLGGPHVDVVASDLQARLSVPGIPR